MGNSYITKIVFGLYHFEIVAFIVLPFNVHSSEPKFLLFWSAKNKWEFKINSVLTLHVFAVFQNDPWGLISK